MRVTNRIIQQDALSSVQSGLQRISDAQRQISSGLRMQKASDDPVRSAGAMQARSSLRGLEQYRRNIDFSGTRISTEEDALSRLGELLVRAKELALAEVGDTATRATRQVAATEVKQLFRDAIGLGNTFFGEGYLFGGGDSATQPYDLVEGSGTIDFTSTVPRGDHSVEISPQLRVPTNHSGAEIFDDSSALSVLRDLANGLTSDDANAVRSTLQSLNGAYETVQNLLGETGARSSQFETIRANLNATEINLLNARSELEEVDIERAITDLVGHQSTLQAAMMATSRVMGMTLADYLR